MKHLKGTEKVQCAHWWEREIPGRRYVACRGQCRRETWHPSRYCKEHRYSFRWTDEQEENARKEVLEQERRQRRSELAEKFADEVSTWSSKKLRGYYAQPETVARAEERERRERIQMETNPYRPRHFKIADIIMNESWINLDCVSASVLLAVWDSTWSDVFNDIIRDLESSPSA